MTRKLGFIGAGNMSSAIIGGIVQAKPQAAGNITASDISDVVLGGLQKELGIKTTSCNVELAKANDIIFLCVKPNKIKEVIHKIRDVMTVDKIIVSIAAGITLEQLQDAFAKDVRIIRTMPNTPALVNMGMTAICPAENVPAADVKFVTSIFEMIGKAQILPENLIHAFIGVAGSAPAYAFMFIEALADAGVKHGLSRKDAIEFSAQTLLGAAKMVINTDSHPAKLRDNVCSPGGTTICAVAKLEEHGFRNAIIQASTACIEKSIEMSGE